MESSTGKNRRASLLFCAFIIGAANCLGNPILLPGGTLTAPAISTTGTSFIYAGTLTQNDTLGFTESNFACLQPGSTYCTNGSGIVTVAGSHGVGDTYTFIESFNGTTAAWNFGALLLEISGAGAKQIFLADAANGRGSSNPPASLTLSPTALSSLGFGNFSVTNPTITFIVADIPGLYSDNSGQFTLTQPTAVPEPSTGLLIAAMSGLALLMRDVMKYGNRDHSDREPV